AIRVETKLHAEVAFGLGSCWKDHQQETGDHRQDKALKHHITPFGRETLGHFRRGSKHDESGSSPARRPLRRMMGEAAKDLPFSRRFDPLPPNDGPNGEKSAYLSGNSTLSANCLSWRRGVLL